MNNNSLNTLFDGLTGKQPESAKAVNEVAHAQSSHPLKKTVKPKEERFCTIASSDLLYKIRLIASREGLQIKDVVNAAFDKAVKTYERRNGILEGEVKGNAKNLF